MTGVRLGKNAKFYLNTGSYGSPTWSAVDLISDLAVKGPWDGAEASTRESNVKMEAQTLMALEVSGKVKFHLTDTNLQTILDAMTSGATLDIMALNGPSTTNGVRGFRFDSQVSMPNEDQSLGVAIFDEIAFKPVPSSNAPSSVKVVTAAPVFTAI